MNYKKLTVHDLKSISRENHIKGYSLLNKEDLIKHIKKNLNKKKKMNGGGDIILNRSFLKFLLFPSVRRIASGNLQKLDNQIESHLIDKTEIDISTIFKEYKQYKLLYTDNIVGIDPNTVEGLINLKTLKLQDNRIKELKINTFNNLIKLEYLYLNNNQITQIEPNTFDGLSSLKELYLGNNIISELKENTFNGLSSLQKLELQNNSINIVKPGVFNGLSSLKELYLGSNKIRALKKNTFNELNNLEKLSLKSNHIDEVEDGAFNGLNNLEILYFTKNVITENYKKENITKAKSFFKKSIFKGLKAGVEIHYGSLDYDIINITT